MVFVLYLYICIDNVILVYDFYFYFGCICRYLDIFKILIIYMNLISDFKIRVFVKS